MVVPHNIVMDLNNVMRYKEFAIPLKNQELWEGEEGLAVETNCGFMRNAITNLHIQISRSPLGKY